MVSLLLNMVCDSVGRALEPARNEEKIPDSLIAWRRASPVGLRSCRIISVTRRLFQPTMVTPYDGRKRQASQRPEAPGPQEIEKH
jgi:hypothetical protein